MTDFALGLAIEIVVAGLLVTTIVYCFILNKRLTRLRADESVLRATIGELITATEIAERAIRGLKVTASDCEASLGRRLMAAETTCSELDRRLVSGEEVLKRISAITQAATAVPARLEPRREEPTAPALAPQPAPVQEPAASAAPVRDGARTLQQAAAEAAERLAAYRRSPREAAA